MTANPKELRFTPISDERVSRIAANFREREALEREEDENAALLNAMFGEGEKEEAPVLTEADFDGEVWERAYEWADGFSDVYGCDHVARERLTVAFASAIKEAAAPPLESFDETVKRFSTFVFATGDVSIQLVKAHIKQFADAIRPRVEFDEAMLQKMMERHNDMSAKICELETQLLNALTRQAMPMIHITMDDATHRLSTEIVEAVMSSTAVEVEITDSGEDFLQVEFSGVGADGLTAHQIKRALTSVSAV